MKGTTSVILMLILTGFVFTHTGCYYDKEIMPATCDSTGITYNGQIKSLLAANCTMCHYSGNEEEVGGGHNYETYNGIRNMALNGKLLRSLNHATGAIPMPRNSPKLPDCDIAKFTNWVRNGAPQ